MPTRECCAKILPGHPISFCCVHSSINIINLVIRGLHCRAEPVIPKAVFTVITFCRQRKTRRNKEGEEKREHMWIIIIVICGSMSFDCSGGLILLPVCGADHVCLQDFGQDGLRRTWVPVDPKSTIQKNWHHKSFNIFT